MLASGLVFLVGALASEWVVHQTSGLTAIWPCNAITLALLIYRKRTGGESVAILVGAFIGSLLSSVSRSQPWELWLTFPIANTLESALAAAIIQRFGGIHGAFDKVSDVIALIVASVMAPIVSALIGCYGLHAAFGKALFEGWLNWYGAAMLGLAVITPCGALALQLSSPRRLMPNDWRLAEAGGILGLIALAALGVFYLANVYISHASLLFAILPLVTLATFRMRQLGAIAGIVIVTLVAAEATIGGQGPIAQTGLSPAQQIIFLQAFLAMTFLTALPVAAALAERDARAEEARTLAEQYRAVVENVDKVIFRMDRDGRWTYLNPAWEEVTGIPVNDVLGESWIARVDNESVTELEEWAAPVLSGEISQTRRMIRLETAHQGTRWMEVSFQALRDRTGGVIGTTGTLRDVDDRKRLEDNVLLAKRRAEERAREAVLLAATDELTGLANRRAFGRHLERLLERANAVGGKLALAIFDVDHFKDVNDSHGHAVGDRVLQRVSTRALQVVRGGDVIGRLGGEEFGILMPGASLDDARAVAERLRLAIQAGAREGEEDLPRVTVSVGIASARAGEQSPATLSQEADRALYAAKREGRNRVRIAA